MCRNVLLVLAISVLAARLCQAQTQGRGYIAMGAGGYANSFASGRVNQFAIGGEAVTPHNVGVGGELELGAGGGDAWFALSLNATHHFPRGSDPRMAPLFTTGYTRLIVLTDRGGRNAVNVGVGTEYWLKRKSSLLLEVRDLVFRGAGATHVWTVRTGLCWK
jgi:hypothetical protein